MNQGNFFWIGKDQPIPLIYMDEKQKIKEICYFYQQTYYRFTNCGSWKYTSKKEIIPYEEYLTMINLLSDLITYYVDDLVLKEKVKKFLMAHQKIQDLKQAYKESMHQKKRTYKFYFNKE